MEGPYPNDDGSGRPANVGLNGHNLNRDVSMVLGILPGFVKKDPNFVPNNIRF